MDPEYENFIKKVVSEAPPLTNDQIDRLRTLLLLTNRPTVNAVVEHLQDTTLTDRETEVLQHIATGKTYRQIGEDLHLSPRTVQAHARNMMKKLGCKNRSQLVRYAVSRGMNSFGQIAAAAAVAGSSFFHRLT